MPTTTPRPGAPVLVVAIAALAAAVPSIAAVGCTSSFATTAAADSGSDGADSSNIISLPSPDATTAGDAPADAIGDAGMLTLSPAKPEVDVSVVDGTVSNASITLTATLGGVTVAPTWQIDRPVLGAIDGVGTFTAAGGLGGTTTVTATYDGITATVPLVVHLAVAQNGATPADSAPGGVGGEGVGGQVDAPTTTALNGTASADPGLAMLYPYNGTVWPRGMLAPLLQWQPGAQSYDAVRIHLSGTYYDYEGYFAQTATPFTHHPIPQGAWSALTHSNAGEPAAIQVTLAAGSAAYGPLVQSWTIAPAALRGTVFYDSYATALVSNNCCTWDDANFGAAVLSVELGAAGPQLVAGSSSMTTGCRACHAISASAGTLTAQHGENYLLTSLLELSDAGATETVLAEAGVYGLGALPPDGTAVLTNAAPIVAESNTTSSWDSLPGGAVLPSTGLPSGFGAAAPSFSPDGTRVSFNFYAGAGSDQHSLAVLDYDPSTNAFSNLTTLFTPPPDAGQTAVWSGFVPPASSVVFELEVRYNGQDWGGTRGDQACSFPCPTGSEGELWWADVATTKSARLDQLNGAGYLPTLASTGHTNDAVLSFEPSVGTRTAGGYAWVVFTSRRLYGNVGTLAAYDSDPRGTNLSKTPSPRKLWVAAIDPSAPPGTDPSHPAFYLPGQELLATNGRAQMIVNACAATSAACTQDDDCCSGICLAGQAGLSGLTCATP